VSSAQDGQAAIRHRHARESEIEGLADDFVAFLEEFEAALDKGEVPPAFAARLAELQQRAERLR